MKFSFNGESFVFSTNVTQWTNARCQESFQSLEAVERVTCKQLRVFYTGGGATYQIEFRKFSVYPYENHLYTNNGNPPLSAFLCTNVDAKAGRRGHVNCDITIATPPGITVPSKCSLYETNLFLIRVIISKILYRILLNHVTHTFIVIIFVRIRVLLWSWSL